MMPVPVESSHLSQSSELPDWTRLMYGPNPDPGAVIKAYEAYYDANPFQKNFHTQYYKRWIREISRALPPVPNKRRRMSGRSESSQWESIGPWDWDHGATDRSYAPGAAHVYTVEQARSNPDILYAGTATAGVWRSGDRGLSWEPLTENFRFPTITALEINHLDPNTVYTELLNSIYKTVDGGAHWTITGDNAFQQLSLNAHDIVMHPEDSGIVFAATHYALFRTLNGGQSWTNVMSGEFQEIEFHPTHPDTIYTIKKAGDKTEFFRSVNGGTSFQLQSTGWPNPNTGDGEHQRRTEIAVTPDAPEKVFALATGMANGGSGLYGVYVSEDAGATWTFNCCGPQPAGPPSSANPNLMGWSDQGLDDGGQFYYDLAFAISPTNADSIYVCGVNLWVSGDGGQSFVCPAAWSHSHKPNYVHADIHDIRISESSHEIWLACDGGIFRSADMGANFTRSMTGIAGTDFWGFGSGFWDGEVMLGGTYHNGTLLRDGDVYVNGWISTDGGDNYRGFVNPGNPREVYSDYNIKSLSGDRTVKNKTRTFAKKPNASYIVGRSGDLLFHPHYFGTWYSGSGTELWKTIDDGYTFSLIHNFGAEIGSMAIALSDPDVIYICTWPDWWGTKRIYRTTDGGTSWAEITPSSALLGGDIWVPYDIAVDESDAQRVWIVRTSMYGNTNLNNRSVFASDDGGMTWQNISTATLDNEAFTCMMHQGGTDGGVYLGTRETVYYRNNAMDDWEWYGDGLPEATFATRLIPYYREGKLRSGTNRSVWESPFYENSTPVARPSVLGPRHNCVTDTVYFRDHSIVNASGATWLWEFPGGVPETSTERNPKVLYGAPGIYSATLTVSDVNGSDTKTVTGFLEVRNMCGLDTIPGMALKCSDFPDYAIAPPLNVTTNTFTISAWVRPEGLQSDYSGIVISDDVACGLNFREGNNTLGYHWAGSGQAWSWDSNLEVPAGAWSHVAMVVSPTSVKLYVNGIESTHVVSHPAMEIKALRIGNYQSWQARNYRGEIDEVCIWNRSLTLDEIRALRHLTKVPSADPDLLLYYQFNEQTSLIYDKAGPYDGVINGDAERVRSRAPVGSGISQSLDILLPGTYAFEDAGLTLSFGVGALVPLGIVYATRLRAMPDTLYPGMVPYAQGYWILNNYGVIQEVTPPEFISLDNMAFLSGPMRDTLGNSLHSRYANADLSGWDSIGADGAEEPGIFGSVVFDTISTTFKTLGQLAVMRDSMIYGRPQVALVHPSDTVVTRRGASSAALSLQSPGKGLLLPQYPEEALEGIPSPALGSMAFVTDLREIVCFDGTQWQVLSSCYLEPPVYAGLPQLNGMSLGGGSTVSAVLGMGNAAGVLVLPVFDAEEFIDIDFPKEGLLIYRSDLNCFSYYNGIDWIHVMHTSTSVPASEAAPTVSVPGMRIGPGTKDPNALLQIQDAARGLAIPVTRCNEVLLPQAGLIIFDPVMKSIVLFDGVGWKMVK